MRRRPPTPKRPIPAVRNGPVAVSCPMKGGRVSPSFTMQRRYAEAAGTRLTVDLVLPADS